MSTGKRLAKRSIIGTRVCAPGNDGKYYSGVIVAVKTPRYSVRFDVRPTPGWATGEFFEENLIGPGFRTINGLHLQPTQKVFVTYKGREIAGEVIKHITETDEVFIQIGTDVPFQVQKRLEDVRLLESRKSARLADIDTDFARLADMAGERGKRSHTIDVPATSPNHYTGSRKRRPSNSQDDSNPFMNKDDQMDECSAALVLMSLSCSPHSPNFSNMSWAGTSPGSSSSASSWRLSPSPPPRETGSPTVPLSSSSGSDEGIGLDYADDLPRKKKQISCTVFKCSWKTCGLITPFEEQMKEHIRSEHLKPEGTNMYEHEEEFYYFEVDMSKLSPVQQQPIQQPQPTLSHRDMARPPHEDPEYQRQFVGSLRQQIFSGPIAIPQSPHKLMKLSPRPHSPKTPVSPRRVRGENKKCRKVYGMEHREQWCTQCKWKKACTRFGD